MDDIKALFTYSSDNVIFTDYDFNILWSNKAADIYSAYNGNCSILFESETLPLKSGIYYINHNGLHFECNVINYPNYNNGIYVIQTKKDDLLLSFVNCKIIQRIIMNQSGELRDAVTGISFSNEVLRSRLASVGMFEEQKHIDISHGNCCKILKSSMNIVELIHYIDGSIKEERIDFSSHLEDFVLNTERILGEKIYITSHIQHDLYIKADANRLSVFLSSIVILANNGKIENNTLRIQAEHIDDYVALTVIPGQCGTDSSDNKFTNHMKMYDCDDVNTDLFVVNRFCKTFGGTLFISESSSNARSFSIRLPYDNSPQNTLSFKSNTNDYSDGLFSMLRIMYSGILY